MSEYLVKLVTALKRRRGPLPLARSVPTSRGLYMVWLNPVGWREVRHGGIRLPPGAEGALYVGVGLGQRGLRGRFSQEWRPRNSGRSSPRRTLGALLLKRLDLLPRPRRDRNPKRGSDYYVFCEEGEARLTDWLETHARFAAVTEDEIRSVTDLDLITIETELIRHVRSPLNLAQAEGRPLRRALEDLRKEMRAIAAQAPPC